MTRFVAAFAAALLAVGACADNEAGPISDRQSTVAVATTTTNPTTTNPTTTNPNTTVPITTNPTTTVPTATSIAVTTDERARCPTMTNTSMIEDGYPMRMSSLVGADIRTGAHVCFERVVIEFAGSGDLPGHRVAFEDDPVLLSPSDQTVEIGGDATLVVRVASWMTSMEGDGDQGPTDIVPSNTRHVVELRMIENFEGMSAWAIGLDRQRPFAVTVLTGPPRIVIDIDGDPDGGRDPITWKGDLNMFATVGADLIVERHRLGEPRHLDRTGDARTTPARGDREPAAGDASSVALVGTFPPTQCGIATYTANLLHGLRTCGLDSRVLRIVDDEQTRSDTRDVLGHWVRTRPGGSASAAASMEPFDSVLVQHEFGIYPGVEGAEVVDFVEQCEPPVFAVLHTVLEDPTRTQRRIVDALVRASQLVIVHTAVAAERLVRVQGVPTTKVAIVPHGAAPNLCGQPSLVSAEPVLLTWGLLGPGKGIERGIEAVTQMRAVGLDVRYVVAGQTHPNVLLREGERYRESLQELARARDVADLVDFSASYRSWDSLRAVVRSADIVLLPYDTRDQVTSGVLVEALAAGRPVVATAFPHAIELSTTGAVATVDHESTDGIASATLAILTDHRRRAAMQAAARTEGASYAWPIVGDRFRRLLTAQTLNGTKRHQLAS